MKNIGGQAVIEGVMMKSASGWSVAVRGPEGEIHVRTEKLNPLPKFLKLPLLRGVVALFHALIIGIKALEYSASKAVDEEEEPLSKGSMAATIGFSILLAIVLFVLVPLYAAKLIGMVLPSVDNSSVQFNLVDGVVRVIVFLVYVWAIGLWSEIKRVFEYHGAEHKVIHAFEHGSGMAPGEISALSPLHPRCGTSFLMIVMIVSIIVFSGIPHGWPLLYKFLARVVLIPLIAGASYEVLKLSAKAAGNPVVRLLIWPGLMLQRLTTREPDLAQIEVAMRALEEVLSLEEATRDA